MSESITGCVTLSARNARATGMWIMLNRRRRAFLPSSVGTVQVGDVVTVTGWQEEDHESTFVMIQVCEPAAMAIPGDVEGLSLVLYGRHGRPDHGLLVLELLGPVLRWFVAAGWGTLAREIAKGSLRTVRTIYQDVFVLYRRRDVPYQVTRYLHLFLGREESAIGHIQALAAEVLLQAETHGESGLTADVLLSRVQAALTLPDQIPLEPGEVLVSSVGRSENGQWYSPTLFFHRQRALTLLRGNQLFLAHPEDPQIRSVLAHRYSIITGPAGSGKTQMVLRVADWCRAQGLRVAMTALTGKAASLLGPEGQTVHRLLGYGGGGYSVACVTADVVFVDEMSMLVWPILSRLLTVCRGQIIFSGDPRQLPPVGSVSVMTELLGCLPSLVLPPFLREDGSERVVVTTVKCGSSGLVQESVVRRVLSCVQEGKEWQVLAPVHDGELGVRRVNQLLQAAVNPQGASVGAGFRVGDRVMVTQNCYAVDPPVYNGMIGTVRGPDRAGIRVHLEEGREVTMDPKIVELAYCLTIYRAQGSRYEYVFVVMPAGIRGGFLQDPRVQEVARTRGRAHTWLLVC
jgi:hypothetical protein